MIRYASYYLFLACTVWVAAPARAETALHLPSNPEISPDGKQIAFDWGGEIYVASADGDDLRQITRHPANDRDAHFSPDGESIAFLSGRDGTTQIYVMPLDGSEAPKQITHHSEGYQLHGWFPDGESLLTTGRRDHYWRDADRMIRVWVDGQRGEQVLADAMAEFPDLSPDGKQIVFVREGERWWRKGYTGERAAQIWLFEIESGKFTELIHDGNECYWPQWNSKGDGFYYTRGQHSGAALWHAELTGDSESPIKAEQIHDDNEHSVSFPASATDTDRVVFRKGAHLYRLDGESKKVRKIELTLEGDAGLLSDELSRTLDSASEVAFHPDGLEVAFIAGGDVWVMETELREPVRVTDTPEYESSLVWGPDQESLWFVSTRDVEIDIYQATRGDDDLDWWQNESFEVDRVTEDTLPKSNLRFSPTGDHLLYVEGNGKLVSHRVEDGKKTTLVEGFDSPDFDISYDGRWVTYSHSDDNFNEDIFLIPTDGSKEAFNVSRHPDNDSQPTFSPDGRLLAFTGTRFDDEVDVYYVYLQDEEAEKSRRDRTLEAAIKKIRKARKQKSAKPKTDPEEDEAEKKNESAADNDETESKKEDDADTSDAADDDGPEPMEIDFEKLTERIKRLPIRNSYERTLLWSPDSKKLAFSATIDGESGLYTVEFPDELSPKLVAKKRLSGAVWSGPAKAILYNDSGVPAKLELSGKSERYTFSTPQQMSRSERFGHGFDVAWRIMRDRWYDPRVGNRNWNQIRRRYRPMATAAVNNRMFGDVMTLMLGELNGSHLGFYPRSDERWSDSQSARLRQTAHLGLRFDADHRGPGLLVRDVIMDGPADKADVAIEPGDIVLRIDGQEVDPAMDLTQVLNGPMDRDIELHVQSSDGDEEETITIRPISYGAARSLLYRQWLEHNRQLVDEQSNGTLGYLHIRAMSRSSFYEFERQLYNAGEGKEGLVIDVRDNGGGSTTDLLLTCLTQPRHAITVPRDGGPGYPQSRMVFATWHKPIIVLCNQNSYSNAEIFSHAIKSLGRGKLVGVTTAGGVISTGSVSVIDVGRMRMPFRAWFVAKTGEDMELNGAVPDVTIWPRPGELPAGKDRQLNRAVKMLKKDVEKVKPMPELIYNTQRDSE